MGRDHEGGGLTEVESRCLKARCLTALIEFLDTTGSICVVQWRQARRRRRIASAATVASIATTKMIASTLWAPDTLVINHRSDHASDARRN